MKIMSGLNRMREDVRDRGKGRDICVKMQIDCDKIDTGGNRAREREEIER